jgi:hypothetical protein
MNFITQRRRDERPYWPDIWETLTQAAKDTIDDLVESGRYSRRRLVWELTEIAFATPHTGRDASVRKLVSDVLNSPPVRLHLIGTGAYFVRDHPGDIDGK